MRSSTRYEWPIRSPDAVLEREGIDRRGDVRLDVRIGRSLVRAPERARQLDHRIAGPPQRQQRAEPRLLQALARIRPGKMIDHHAHARSP
jgi:hypothetical protein